MFSLLLIVPIGVVLIYNNYTEESKPSELKDIEYHGSFAEFNYEELTEQATVIATVIVNDDLTLENSTLLYANEETNDIYGFIGEREVTVLEYYKNEPNAGETLSLIEPAAITEENEYLRADGYEALEKGKLYLVFLSSDNATNQLSIISANNGVFDLENPEENEKIEILEEAEEELPIQETLEEHSEEISE